MLCPFICWREKRAPCLCISASGACFPLAEVEKSGRGYPARSDREAAGSRSLGKNKRDHVAFKQFVCTSRVEKHCRKNENKVKYEDLFINGVNVCLIIPNSLV